MTQMDEATIRERMKQAVDLWKLHQAKAQTARDQMDQLEETIREQSPPDQDETENKWPNRTNGDDLSDLHRMPPNFHGARNIQDRLLILAAAAGDRELEIRKVAMILVETGQHHTSATSLRNHVRAAFMEKPELYQRTDTNTFRYRWA